MKKRLILMGIMLLLVLSIFALAQEESPAATDQPPGEEAEECGFWCKAGEFLWGTGEGEKALVGKAGGIWGKAAASCPKGGSGIKDCPYVFKEKPMGIKKGSYYKVGDKVSKSTGNLIVSIHKVDETKGTVIFYYTEFDDTTKTFSVIEGSYDLGRETFAPEEIGQVEGGSYNPSTQKITVGGETYSTAPAPAEAAAVKILEETEMELDTAKKRLDESKKPFAMTLEEEEAEMDFTIVNVNKIEDNEGGTYYKKFGVWYKEARGIEPEKKLTTDESRKFEEKVSEYLGASTQVKSLEKKLKEEQEKVTVAEAVAAVAPSAAPAAAPAAPPEKKLTWDSFVKQLKEIEGKDSGLEANDGTPEADELFALIMKAKEAELINEETAVEWIEGSWWDAPDVDTIRKEAEEKKEIYEEEEERKEAVARVGAEKAALEKEAVAPAPVVTKKIETTEGWKTTIDEETGNLEITTPTGNTFSYNEVGETKEGKTIYSYEEVAEERTYFLEDGTRVDKAGKPIPGGEKDEILGTTVRFVTEKKEAAPPLPPPEKPSPELVKTAKGYGIDTKGKTKEDLDDSIRLAKETFATLKENDQIPANTPGYEKGKPGKYTTSEGRTIRWDKDAKLTENEPPHPKDKERDMVKDMRWDQASNSWKEGKVSIDGETKAISLSDDAPEELKTMFDNKEVKWEYVGGKFVLYNKEKGDAYKADGDRDYARSKTYPEMWAKEWGPLGTFLLGDTGFTDVMETVTAGLRTMGDWRGLSSWWMPDTTAKLTEVMTNVFGTKLQAERFLGLKEACGYDEKHSAEQPGEAYLFIETIAGTYQFVGAIQAERSPKKTYILCNPSEEIEEEERCPGDLVCKEEACYENEEALEPAKGYFYKASWGVTAPQDEKFTPYIDENGKAVKFNLMFSEERSCAGRNWFYSDEKGRRSVNTIQLTNGESDQGTILDYSPREYNYVCICWGAAPKDRDGDEVGPICAPIKESEAGEIEFKKSGRTTTATVKSGKVVGGSLW